VNRRQAQLFILLPFILFFIGCGPSASTDAIPPASGAGGTAPFGMSPGLLRMESSTSDMTILSGDNRTDLGTARTEASSVSLEGRRVIQFVLVQELRQGTMFDTLWVDAGTLLPVRYRNTFGDLQSIRMEYGNDGHIASEVVRSGTVTGIDTTITGPHLDAAEFPMLIPALPLADDYAAEIPVVHYEDGTKTYSVRVIGSDQVPREEGTRDVWIVENDSGVSVARYFIDKKTREVLKVTAEVGPGRTYEQVAR